MNLAPWTITLSLCFNNFITCEFPIKSLLTQSSREMSLWPISLILGALERVLQSIFSCFLYLSLAIAVGHYFGWIERWIWYILEKEATKIVNGSKITIGSFRLDWSKILQGKIVAEVSNAVLHTPQRQLWGWESPLIARVGKAKVEVNAPITIIHEIILRMKLPLEIYSVYVADVQVFVERHDQVINVYLCDPAAVLPTPPYLTPIDTNQEGSGTLDESKSSARIQSDPVAGVRGQHDGLESASSGQVLGEGETALVDGNDKQKEQAQQLVNNMLQAVQSLGRAAQKGSLNTAMKQQGIEMAEILRDGLSTRNRKTSELEHGVALMEQVGKVAVESFKTPQLILPERNVSAGGPEPPMARVGRILLRDIRVFTKDSWIEISLDEKNNKKTKVKEHKGAFGGSEKDEDRALLKKGNWNKPILIEELVVRASELCPPLSMKDDEDPDFPAVYQRIDKIVEIVWRRLLAEMAKSSGGRLFSTAIGEVLSFIQSNPQGTGATPKSTKNITGKAMQNKQDNSAPVEKPKNSSHFRTPKATDNTKRSGEVQV